MFFSETLGPALTPFMANDLFKHVKIKLSGRTSASLDELHGAISDYLRKHGIATTPENAIELLVQNGKLSAEPFSPGKFRLAR